VDQSTGYAQELAILDDGTKKLVVNRLQKIEGNGFCPQDLDAGAFERSAVNVVPMSRCWGLTAIMRTTDQQNGWHRWFLLRERPAGEKPAKLCGKLGG